MNLLQLELRKLVPYKAFWVVLGLFIVLFLLIFSSSRGLTINGSTMGEKLYSFPAVWQNGAWLASFFNLLLSILVIVIVTDEYSFRTLRQQVIDGLSRKQLVLAKVMVILLVAAGCTLVVAIASFVFGTFYNDGKAGATLTNTEFIAGYFVHAVAYMSLALLVAIIVKRSGLAIMAFLLYAYVVERLLRSQTDDNIDKYFPMKVFDALTPSKNTDLLMAAAGIKNETLGIEMAIAMGVFYILLFWALSYVLLKMRDL